MGTHVAEEIRDQTYLIAPVSYRGFAQFANGYNPTVISKAREDSIKWYLSKVGKKYLFLDAQTL